MKITLAIATLLAAPAALAPAAHAQELIFDLRSPEAQEVFDEARRLFHITWFEQADDLFQEAMALAPEEAVIPAYLAVVDYLLYRDPGAHVARARQLAGPLTDGRRRFVDALLHYAEGDHDQVEADLRAVLDEYPDDPVARHRLGSVLFSAQRHDEAVTILSALVADRPDYAGARNHLGYALLALDRTDEAVEAFADFLAATPGNPSAHDSYAEALARSGDLDAALGHLLRAVLIEPRFAYGWMHMGDLLREAGDRVEALAAYDHAAAASGGYGPAFRDGLARRRAALAEE